MAAVDEVTAQLPFCTHTSIADKDWPKNHDSIVNTNPRKVAYSIAALRANRHQVVLSNICFRLIRAPFEILAPSRL
jgi:hypothetical protein